MYIFSQHQQKQKMFSDDHTRYALLTRQNNLIWRLEKRTFILITVLTFPIIVFCASYMTLFGIYDQMLYPKNLQNVSEHSLRKAVLYNSILFSNKTYRDLHIKNDKPEIKKYKLVCYYNFPSDENSLQIKDLDPHLCTHINLAFATIVNNSLYLNERQENYLRDLVNIKKDNKDLKILVSVGGGGTTGGFPEMVRNHTCRKSFIKSILYYVKSFHIDGVDLDWEFPNENPGTDKKQRVHFTQLLEEIRKEIDRQESHKFLLSVAVAAPVDIAENSYDVPYMNEFVDFVNLMTYDFHFYTRSTPFTGINSPLYSSENDLFFLATLNINYTANYWNNLGMDRSKIVIGLPLYGHTFKLRNPKNTGLYAPSEGYGKLGDKGFADYSQICSFLNINHITPIFDMETKSPYATKSLEWISFDDTESLTYKSEFIRDNNFGGAMVYSFNSDDFKGVCKGKNSEKFPLLKSIQKVLNV